MPASGTDTGDGWTKTPRWVRRADWSTPLHMAVYAAVQWFAGPSGVCFANRGTIAAEAKVSPATVKRCLADLAAGGAVVIEHRAGTSTVIKPKLSPVSAVPLTASTVAELADTPEALADPRRVRELIDASLEGTELGALIQRKRATPAADKQPRSGHG